MGFGRRRKESIPRPGMPSEIPPLRARGLRKDRRPAAKPSDITGGGAVVGIWPVLSLAVGESGRDGNSLSVWRTRSEALIESVDAMGRSDLFCTYFAAAARSAVAASDA